MILSIMKGLLKEKSNEILLMDCWDIQVFLGRKIYEIAEEEGTLISQKLI